MKFSNPDRWGCLLNRDYSIAWFDNIMAFAKEASMRNIMLYTINYPGLCSFEDSPGERDIYVENSRLTNLFADYQAVSKRRIQKTLSDSESVIPSLDVEKKMAYIRGKERLTLFIDEIHMSASGNALFGTVVSELLLQDKAFKDLFEQGATAHSNVAFDQKRINALREKDIGANYDYIDNFIALIREKLKRSKKHDDTMELPTERYTTF